MIHQYIQEPILSLNHFYFNTHSIIHAVCYWCVCFYYLFSRCLCLWLVIYFLVKIFQYVFHSSWYYRIWHKVMYVGELWLAQVRCDIILLIYLFQSIVDYVPVWLLYWALLGSVCNQLQEWLVTSYMTDPSSIKTVTKFVYCIFRE